MHLCHGYPACVCLATGAGKGTNSCTSSWLHFIVKAVKISDLPYLVIRISSIEVYIIARLHDVPQRKGDRAEVTALN